jgi:hypothetical protein
MIEPSNWGPKVAPAFRAIIHELDDVDLVILERSPILTRDQWVVVCGEMIGRRLPTPARRNGMSAVWELVRQDLIDGAAI